MLKVGLIGCGKIADSHMEQINRISGAKVVAACDSEPLMSEQLCERFGIEKAFSDLPEMLREAQPDVVHITTPPQSHFQLGKLCLESGCHVYVEKPFTLFAREAADLLSIARRCRRLLTVGHDLQFSPAARRMRELVKSGYLGGSPVHMESYYSYDLGDPKYARALLGNQHHWARRLPGKLLHNLISHGIARIAEFLTGDDQSVLAHGFVSPVLAGLGEEGIFDELRVVIFEHPNTTAYFTFTSSFRPALNGFRVYGPKNGIYLDEGQQTVIKLPGGRLKSYAERVLPQLSFATQYVGNSVGNCMRFARNQFHMKSGMHYLISGFYRAILTNAPCPISHKEILSTSRIMENIFRQLHPTSFSAVAGLPEPSRELN